MASYVGMDSRATMDINTTLQALPLAIETATKAIHEIIETPIEDGVTFQIADAWEIMEEHEYPGLRFMLDGFFEKIKQSIKIDISTGDTTTPTAIEYSYPLMFEKGGCPHSAPSRPSVPRDYSLSVQIVCFRKLH